MTIQDLSFPLAIATFYGCMCTHAENNGLAAIALGVLVLVLADLTILLVYTIVEGLKEISQSFESPTWRNVDEVG